MKTLIAGTFDNFHIGHQWLIWNAVDCHELVVIVACDSTVKKIKKHSPRNSEQGRLNRVEAELVNKTNAKVRLGRSDADFWATITEEAPDRIFLGYDQKFDKKECRSRFPNITIERCSEYFPEYFKSSKF